MSRFTIIILTFFYGTASHAFAQPESDAIFFPLRVGNYWTYSGDQVIRVSESIMKNGLKYYILTHSKIGMPPVLFADTLRADFRGNIWASESGEDHLLFNFTLAPEESYEYNPVGWPLDIFKITSSWLERFEIRSSVFHDVIRLLFDIPEARDDEIWFTFARGIGLINQSNIWFGAELESAFVNGATTSVGTERVPVSNTLQEIVIFPNPISTHAEIRIPALDGIQPHATVYDVLGRKVIKLSTSVCSSSACIFDFDGYDLVAGIYVVVATNSSGIQTQLFSLIK